MADTSAVAEYIHPQLRNLAADLGDDELKDIARRCLEDYRTDEDSRKEWLSMHTEALRLYFQQDKPLNGPWEGSSTESMPLMSEACTQFASRAYSALFPNRQILKAVPTGKVSDAVKERAERVGRHMSYQITVKDRAYKRNKRRLLTSLAPHGSFFTKTYYHPVLKRNVVENVRAVDFVVPYGTGPRDLEEIDRKTHVIYTGVEDTKRYAASGYFLEEAKPYEKSEKTEYDQAHDTVTGLTDQNLFAKTECKLIEQHRTLDLDGDGIAEPYIVVIDCQAEKVLRVAIRYDTDELGNPIHEDKRPTEYFTHYAFIENPDGFYGLGMWHLIGQLNISVNKLLRQTVDAGTLSNVGNMSGIINKSLGLKKGEWQMQLGKFTTTETPIEDINRGIFQFKFPGPQAVLYNVMQLLMARSDRLASNVDVLSGQTENVMQPTAIMALIDEGLKVFSSIYEALVDSWGMELEKLYSLNAKFMDPAEYFSVQDMDGMTRQYDVGRDDYISDLKIQPIIDPKMTTMKQRLAKAESEWAFLSQNPLVLNSPMHLYNASRRYLEAVEAENIDEVLPRPMSEMMPRIEDPGMENLLAMADTPVMPMVYPDQDHAMHIAVHMQLWNNPQLGGAGRSALWDHITSHRLFEQAGVVAGNAAQGGSPGMGGNAGGQMVLPGATQQGQSGLDSSGLLGTGSEDARKSGSSGNNEFLA